MSKVQFQLRSPANAKIMSPGRGGGGDKGKQIAQKVRKQKAAVFFTTRDITLNFFPLLVADRHQLTASSALKTFLEKADKYAGRFR